jgi:hypothetical protein
MVGLTLIQPKGRLKPKKGRIYALIKRRVLYLVATGIELPDSFW